MAGAPKGRNGVKDGAAVAPVAGSCKTYKRDGLRWHLPAGGRITGPSRSDYDVASALEQPSPARGDGFFMGPAKAEPKLRQLGLNRRPTSVRRPPCGRGTGRDFRPGDRRASRPRRQFVHRLQQHLRLPCGARAPGHPYRLRTHACAGRRCRIRPVHRGPHRGHQRHSWRSRPALR